MLSADLASLKSSSALAASWLGAGLPHNPADPGQPGEGPDT